MTKPTRKGRSCGNTLGCLGAAIAVGAVSNALGIGGRHENASPTPSSGVQAVTTTAEATATPAVSTGTLDRLHGHCLNASDDKIEAMMAFGSKDLADHGLDESAESVASHIADIVQGMEADCQGTLAAYLVLREGG